VEFIHKASLDKFTIYLQRRESSCFPPVRKPCGYPRCASRKISGFTGPTVRWLYDRARDSLINLIKPRRNRVSTRSERRARYVRRNCLGGRNTTTNSSPRRSEKARYISRRVTSYRHILNPAGCASEDYPCSCQKTKTIAERFSSSDTVVPLFRTLIRSERIFDDKMIHLHHFLTCAPFSPGDLIYV